MTTRLDETGLPPVNPLPHPTPQHIKACIAAAIHRSVAADGSITLYGALQAVEDGAAQACREHDAERLVAR